MDDVTAELVLLAVERVPAGSVVSYGDIADLVGIGPRQVGAVMSAYGSEVAWWRVTSATGDLPAHLRDEAAQRWAHEGIGRKASGSGCRISAHRADLARLAEQWAVSVADLGITPRGSEVAMVPGLGRVGDLHSGGHDGL